MNRIASLSGILLALGAASAASAGITVTSSMEGYANAIAGRGYLTAEFMGPAISAPEGGAGWNAWVASAPGGEYLSGSTLSTAMANDPLTINFSSGQVGAVGGTFYLTDASRATVLSSLIEITLSNGEMYVSESSPTNFAGFVADAGMSISSITIKPFMPMGGGEYATVSSLVVSGVPAPGSIALLGAAGIAARRKRR
jgi:hypothetical protein